MTRGRKPVRALDEALPIAGEGPVIPARARHDL